MKLAEKIIYHRKRLNLSQEELSKKLGVSRQAVSKWESGQTIPDLDKLVMLSQAFGESLDELIRDGEITSPVQNPKPIVTMPEIIEEKATPKRKSKWRKVLIISIISFALLIIIGGYENRLRNLENQIQNTSSQIGSISSSIQLSMNNLIQQVRDEMIYQNGIIEDYRVDSSAFDFKNETITYVVDVLFKKTSQVSQTVLTITNEKDQTQNIALKQEKNGYYRATFDYSMRKSDFRLTVSSILDGVTETQSLGVFDSKESLLYLSANLNISSYSYRSIEKDKDAMVTISDMIYLRYDENYYNGEKIIQGDYLIRVYEAEKTLPSMEWLLPTTDTGCIQTTGFCQINGTEMIKIKPMKFRFNIGDELRFTIAKKTETGIFAERAIYTIQRTGDDQIIEKDSYELSLTQ